MTKEMQPEALRLADELEQWAKDYAPTDFTQEMAEKSSAELRRLYARVHELEKELANERCLSFRAQVEQLEAQLEAQRKPLTHDEAAAVCAEIFGWHDTNTMRLVLAIERAHGIGEVA